MKSMDFKYNLYNNLFEEEQKMRIVDLLHKQGMNLDSKPSSKAECIDILVDLMDKTGNLNDKEEYKKVKHNRYR